MVAVGVADASGSSNSTRQQHAGLSFVRARTESRLCTWRACIQHALRATGDRRARIEGASPTQKPHRSRHLLTIRASTIVVIALFFSPFIVFPPLFLSISLRRPSFGFRERLSLRSRRFLYETGKVP